MSLVLTNIRTHQQYSGSLLREENPGAADQSRDVYLVFLTRSVQCYLVLTTGAALKRSQCATGGGVGDKPLNDMEERVVGLLNVEAMIGIPGAFDIGVPVEVPNGEPFSLPLSDTTAEPSRPSSVRPRHTSQADNIPERPQGDADVHGASGGGLQESEALPYTSGSRRSNHKRSRDAPSHEIIETQEAIVERLDRIVVLQEQMVALKAYKLNVRFENGKIVPRY
ncbi:uncharacterized protein LOC115321017 [Ixodes scapularis]|uniref:uncharacterized protein LOC115321017 n=1 Tax=Ixodes scapularis TaxID=6945 RepID=UPI001A9D69EC|nr:uncharacterized protein LOC115321017 [Ixodes scapularis]